jgi:aminoglycoside phosphotransferase (APT) family kinase protein
VDERALEIIDLYRLLLLDCGQRGERCPVIQPLCYAREQRVLVIPWVHGISLSDAMRATRREIIDDALAHAPRALAQLHASLLVPEDPTTADDMVQATASRWHHHFVRFPDTRQLVTPLINLLQDALPHLSPASPTLVHGDSAPGNILQDGASWQLLDLDTFGYADPAYDVGYLLARLEHECLLQPAFHDRAPELVVRMLRACLEEMPDVSTSNVAFYYAMTLIRKVLSRYLRTHSFKRNARWPVDVAHVVASATKALNAVASRTSPSFAAENPVLRETGDTRSRH